MYSIKGAKGTFAKISMGAKETFARITIKIAKGIIALVFNQESKGDFCQDFYGSEGTFARITIKIAKETIALVFKQGSSESVSKRILKVQACLKMALDWR